ncbi:tripartite tricarboxylate transporter substrate binding protein [soil metagenome]
MTTLRTRLACTTFACIAVLSAPAFAVYPDKPVHLVVPNPPGGTTDLLARFIANELSQTTKQTFIVDNKAGAGGAIAAQYVAKSTPDGYTLMMANINSHMINAAVNKNLTYDPVKDFSPVTIVGSTPNVLIVNPSVPAKNLAELLALLRANPGKYSFGSTSAGGSPHMSGELLKSVAKVDIQHVPYKGAAPMLNDLLGGQIPMAFDNLPSSLAFIKAGKVRAIAVTTTTRWPGAPEIPTMAESGLKDYEVSAWFGVVAPAGTPRDVIDTLYKQIAAILKAPGVEQRLLDMGAAPGGITPEAFAKEIRDGIAKWTAVADAAGIKLD